MTTIDYTQFARYCSAEYPFGYCLVNYSTGEIRTTACVSQAVALRSMYRRMDGEHRANPEYRMVLANVRTGAVVCAVNMEG
jgi:hypothetical protein